MKTNRLTLTFILFTISVMSTLNAQKAALELKGLLEQIRAYEYGQSRENMTAISDLLRIMGNSDEMQKEAEEELINFLKADATLPAKQFICECLSIYGSDESVPILGKLLFENKTESMALFALERIPAEEASEVLMEALSETDGNLKVGIINALGNRRVKDAVDEITPLIWDTDILIAYAAVSATGHIGGENAAAALKKALADPTHKLKSEIIHASLKCAADYETSHENNKALAIYQSLDKSEFDPQFRQAALRGIIRSSGQKATDVILTFFENESPEKYTIVIPLVQEIPSSEDITPIIDQFTKMKPDDQVKLLGLLAGRKEPAVVRTMIKATEDRHDQIRIAALSALSLSGDAETVHLLVGVAAGRSGLEKATAQNSLDRLNAPGTDDLIIKSIPLSDDMRKIELIRCTSSRYITSASSLLNAELQSTNPEVRIAAIKALKDIGSPDQLNALISYHLKTENGQERTELENTIVAISKRIPESQSQAGYLLSNIDKLDNNNNKASYLEMLGKIGDPKSLSVLDRAIKGKDEELKTSAIRGLSNWPDSKPADDLFMVGKSSTNQIHQALALRGYLNLLDRDDLIDPKDKTEKYKQAMILAKSVPEKRLVLSGIATVSTLEAFTFATSYLDDADVRGEAESAVIRIARRLGLDYIDTTLPVIKKVNIQTQSEEVREESGEIIDYFERGEED